MIRMSLATFSRRARLTLVNIIPIARVCILSGAFLCLHTKKPVPTVVTAGTGTYTMTCGATRLDDQSTTHLTHTIICRTLFTKVPAPSSLLFSFQVALRSPFSPAFPAAITPHAALTFEPLRNLLTLHQRFYRK